MKALKKKEQKEKRAYKISEFKRSFGRNGTSKGNLE
jgi:hypothetical protein